MKRPSRLITRLKQAVHAAGLTAKPQCPKCWREVELKDLGRGGLCVLCSGGTSAVRYL